MKRIGVLLSGCGVYDGSEIHEAVLTLLAIDRADAESVCMAPDIEQTEVVDHLTGEPAKGEARNVLSESARIARGHIRNLATVKVEEIDALILPGGYGVVKNLSDYAFNQEGPIEVEPAIASLIDAVFQAKKPLGFICIAPVIAASILGKHGVELTIGHDDPTSASVVKMGSPHIVKAVTEIHRDPTYPVVSTPAYMLADRISSAATGIEKLVAEVIRLIP